MSGIYIHIPYCKQKCTYCNFHFSTNTKNVEEMISAMLIEIENKKNYLKKNEIHTIYFGGGTPSFIESKKLNELLEKIKSLYKIIEDAEITIELNPDDITETKLKKLKSIGFNRLSIGVQSFFEEDLKFMNRSHSGKEAIDSIKLSQKSGFKNITIDLIYGLPNLSNTNWKKNLTKINSLGIKHFSAYALTVEPKTKLDYLIKSKKINAISDDKIVEQFKILQEKTSNMGFVQYEISNFCKNENYSKHNSSYWKRKNYIGIGPSAHSFNGNQRQWNIKSNSKYIEKIKKKEKYFEIENISKIEKYNEYILTSLRTIWGVNHDYIKSNFDEKINLNFKNSVKKWLDTKNVINKNGHYNLTNKGMIIADSISSDLFFVQDS